MRLVASHSQRKAHVAKVLRHEIVKRFGLLQISVKPLGQVLCLATDFRGGYTAIFFKTRIPASNLFPGPESGQLNVRPLVVASLLLFLLVLLFLFFVVFTFQVGIRPVIGAPSILLGNLWIHSRLVLEFHGTVGRSIDIELLIEHDVVLVEVVFGPELTRRQGRVHHRDHVTFQHFARTQARNRNVLLTIVSVDRRFTFNRGAEILHRVITGLHDGAIFLENPDIGDLYPLVGGVIPNLQLTPLLDAGLTLHSNAGNRLSAPRAVAVKTITRAQLLDDKRFLGIVRLLLRRLVRRGRCWLGNGGYTRSGCSLGLLRSVRSLALIRLSQACGGCGDTEGTNKDGDENKVAHKIRTRPCAVCIVSREVAQLGTYP